MKKVEFTFQTTSSNGILVIGIDENNSSLYQAMELSNGYFVFKYNVGLEYKQVRSKKQYDTGKQVSVKKSRGVRQRGEKQGWRYTLTIESSGEKETLAQDILYYPNNPKAIQFLTSNYVYWGGIENRTTIPENV